MTLLEVNRFNQIFSAQLKVGAHLEPMFSPPEFNIAQDLTQADWYMYVFKIQPCPIKTTHPWEHCCYAHPHENARRRDPRKYQYIAEPCPDYKRGICLLGSQCPYAHGVYERNLHPSKYRTQLCTEGDACSRRVCFFAHAPYQLRAPSHTWSIAEAEYVRQVLLERIIHESEQAALREQAAAALAASRSLGLVHPHQQQQAAAFSLQQQQQQPGGPAAGALAALRSHQQQQQAQQQQLFQQQVHMQQQLQMHAHLQQQQAQAQAQQAQQAAAAQRAYSGVMSPFQQQQLQQHLGQGLGDMRGGGLQTANLDLNVATPFAHEQVVGSPTSLQLPATPPAAPPLPARNTSSSPVRAHPDGSSGGVPSPAQEALAANLGAVRAMSPEARRAAAGVRLRNALSQPVPEVSPPGGRGDLLAGGGDLLAGGEGALGAASANLFQAVTGLPIASQAMVRAHRAGRAVTEDAEGPRMSMAMRRQLGIAPAKSPSKAGSAAMAAALQEAASGQLRAHGSPNMSPAHSGTLPGHMSGLVGQPGGYEGVSQGLLLQQAALALQMAHLGSPVANTGLEGSELSDASSALATVLRQQGASASSEVSADDYAGLIGRLHSMRVSFMGEPSAGSAETNATSSGTPNTGFGEEDLRTASGCSTTAPFDMELSPTQMLSPHKSSPLASHPGLEHGQPTSVASSSAPIFDQAGQSTSFFSY